MHIHARSKAEQSDVQQSEVSESIDSLNSFLERDYECHFEHGFAPSCLRYSAASRENESKFALNLVTISIKIYLRNPFQNHWKSMQNQWKSVLGAMLAQDDTYLEPSLLKMTPRIAFWSTFDRFWGAQNASKIHSKMKQFSDTHWNLVFCAWSSQTLQNEGPKQLPN